MCSSGSQRYYFSYDADGRRTKITAAAGGMSTTTELRYADGRISAEYVHTCDLNGCTTPVLARSYVSDETGAIVKMVIPGQPNAGTYLVTWNGHGDALNLLRLDGGTVTLANSFSYDTWGQATVTTHNGIGDLGFRFRYTGQFGVQDDTVHGLPLLLMGARHYAPQIARFIQPDPTRAEWNAYAYTGNNPVSRMDADGTFWWLIPVILFLVRVGPIVYRVVRFVVPVWVKNAASLANWARNLETAFKVGKEIASSQTIRELLRLAKQYGIKVTCHKGHPGTLWNIPHLHVGHKRFHVPLPHGFWPPGIPCT